MSKPLSHRSATNAARAEPLESRLMLADAVRVSDILQGPESSLALSSGEYVAANGKFFFTAVNEVGRQPFVSDGTGAGTRPLAPLGLNGDLSADPQNYVYGKGFVY